jgi:hypothetical protein
MSMWYLKSREEIMKIEGELDLININSAIYFPDSGVVCS